MGQALKLPQVWREVREAYDHSGLTLRELAALSGLSKSKIQRVLNGQSPLTVDMLITFGVALRFDPADLVTVGERVLLDVAGANQDPATQKSAQIVANLFDKSRRKLRVAGRELSVETMVGWHQQTGGKLENAGLIMPYISAFETPKSELDQLEAVHVGPKCLAFESLGTHDPTAIKTYVNSLAPDTRHEVIFSYFSTRTEQYYRIHPRHVTVDLPGPSRPFELKYATLLLPMKGNKGRDVVVNFSSLTSVNFLDLPQGVPMGSQHSTPRAAQTGLD